MKNLSRVAVLTFACLFPPFIMAAAWPEDVEPTGVMPIVSAPTGLSAPDDLETVQQRIYVAIEKQAHRLLADIHPWSEDENLRLITESKHEEHWIRPNTGTVLGFAFLCRFGAYDASVVGVSHEDLLKNTVLPMMRYLATTHLTGSRPTSSGERWGSQWQSAHWAHMLGRAAWWVWDDLPEDVRAGVRAVIAHEADRIAATAPPHAVLQDTKAEENAWNSQVLSVAVVLMPEDARRPAWERAYQVWALSSFLRDADKTSSAIVDGQAVSAQFTGANIYDDFTLENHGRVHPDYMTTYVLSMGCILDYTMSGRRSPEAASYNTAGIYENMKWFSLPSGGLVYPNGQDWELYRDPEWLYLHALMAAQGNDPDAWSLLRPCLDTQDRMQARSPSGTVYLEEEYFFPSTLSDQICYNAMAWLALTYRGPIVDQPKIRRGVRRFDSGKFILNRTETAIHSVSWGAQVMAQVMAYRLDRITSPDPRSGFGEIRIDGDEEPLPLRVRKHAVSNEQDRYQVTFEVEHGKNQVQAFIEFRSEADGTFWISERLVALADITTSEVATGLVGILNNPLWVYERGERTVTFGDETRVVKSGDGITFEAQDVADANVDGVLLIHGETPLHMFYRGAREAERARFTDKLYLNYIGEKRSWKTGQEISSFTAHITCAPEAPVTDR
jgi:hypothetical protein